MMAWPWPQALGIASSVSGTEPDSWTFKEDCTITTGLICENMPFVFTHSCEEAQTDSTEVSRRLLRNDGGIIVLYVHTYVQHMNINMVYMYSSMHMYMPYIYAHTMVLYIFL